MLQLDSHGHVTVGFDKRARRRSGCQKEDGAGSEHFTGFLGCVEGPRVRASARRPVKNGSSGAGMLIYKAFAKLPYD